MKEQEELEIREMRKALGMSQTEFGNMLGIPMRTIQNWEMGTRKPPEYIIKLIEKSLLLAQHVADIEKELASYKNNNVE